MSTGRSDRQGEGYDAPSLGPRLSAWLAVSLDQSTMSQVYPNSSQKPMMMLGGQMASQKWPTKTRQSMTKPDAFGWVPQVAKETRTLRSGLLALLRRSKDATPVWVSNGPLYTPTT